MAAQMSFLAAAGHACGISFKSAPFLRAHPEFAWQTGFLGDMNAHKWTRIP